MKKIFLLNLVLLAAIFSYQLYSEDKDTRIQEQERAKQMYRRFMESAHPTKIFGNEEKSGSDVKVPFLIDETVDLFLNVSTIDSETGIEWNQLMQNESSVAVNPKNPLNLIASAVDYRDTSAAWVYVSDDGGKNWKNIKLGRPYTGWRSSNDPSVAFDPDGVGYLVYGGFGTFDNTTTQLVGENGVFMAKTTDQGATWKAHIPVIVHQGVQTLDSTFEDKYYITVDNSPESQYYKHLYIPWKRMFARDSATQIVLAKSTDKGETWSIPVPVSKKLTNTSEDTTYGQSWPLVACGPKGEVYAIWNIGTEHSVGFAKSTDGGLTFSQPKIIQTYERFGTTRDISSNINFKEFRHTVKGKVRAESYPVIMCDIRDGKNKGNLYLCWSGGSVPDIFFARSSNGGDTWSEPVTVHSDKKHDQFWPWMNVDPLTGDIMVSYFDSRNDTANHLVECFVSYSSDAGVTWIDRRAEDFAHDITKNPFYGHFAGDYSGLAFYNGIGYPTWVDMRNVQAPNFTDSDVYTAIINTKIPAPPDELDVKIIAEEQSKLKLTWKPVYEKAFGQPINPQELKFAIYRDGKFLSTVNGDISEFTDSGLTPFSKYRYNVNAFIGADTSMPAVDSNFAGGSRNPGRPEIAGWEGNPENDIVLNVKLPGFREDGETPLVNLANIALYRNNTFMRDVPVDPADAGKTIQVNDTPGKKGWYQYKLAVKDNNQPPNTSSYCDDKLVYTGLLPHFIDDSFEDEEEIKWFENKWGITSSFAKTGTHSLTDSPTGNYDNNKSNSTYMFPVEVYEDYLNVSFWHASIVDKRDTCFFEYSTDKGESWVTLAKYNELDYDPWHDGVLNNTDWKFESFGMKPNDKDLVFRFRIWSNLLTAKDGWYIDEFSVMQANSVIDATKDEVIAYPNPAVNFVNIRVPDSKSANIMRISLQDLFGRKVVPDIMAEASGNEYKLDLTGIASGNYRIIVHYSGNNLSVLNLSVVK